MLAEHRLATRANVAHAGSGTPVSIWLPLGSAEARR
jgi:hypothetical protein